MENIGNLNAPIQIHLVGKMVLLNALPVKEFSHQSI